MSAEFLSPEWFSALERSFASSPPLSGDGAVRIGESVPDAPGGERSWTFVLSGGSPPELVVGSVEEADVVLVVSYDAARSLAEGRRSAGDLLEHGELKLRGDARVLAAGLGLLEQLAPSLTPRAT